MRALSVRVDGAGRAFERTPRLCRASELVEAVRARKLVCRLEVECVRVAVEGDDELGAGVQRERVGRVARED